MHYKQWIVVAMFVATATFAATTITGPTVSPSTITFSSPNPDVTPANGSTAATIQWAMAGNAGGAWSAAVQATSSSLTGCPAVPVSAIKFQCTSLSLATNGAGTCSSGTFTLSTSPQTVASGSKQGKSGNTVATVSFTFTDGWKYPASSSCSTQLTYTINAQ
jgi:hypothetical protein